VQTRGNAFQVIVDGAVVDGVVDGAADAVAPGTVPESPRRVRIIDATLDCLARHGTTKTTVDDIARRAGVSRATVYRVFPGGRDEILGAVVDTEMARLFSALGVRLGEAGDLTEALVGGIVEASTRLRDHAALAYLVEHEPEMVLGHLAFDESDRLLVAASHFTAPFLARWMSPKEAERVTEWATRIVLSYAIAPSDRMDLTEPAQTAHLVTTFVLPGIRSLHDAGTPTVIDITPFGSQQAPPDPPALLSSGSARTSRPSPDQHQSCDQHPSTDQHPYEHSTATALSKGAMP
jgi:AcrR family transcriptional regulator